jgi:hypothetical protein
VETKNQQNKKAKKCQKIHVVCDNAPTKKNPITAIITYFSFIKKKKLYISQRQNRVE